MKPIVLSILLALPLSLLSQTTWYVNDDASGANDGTSWTHALTNLQEALDTAYTIDSIFVAAGTYYPNSNPYNSANSRLNTFYFDYASALRIYGGFAGSESSLADRAEDSVSLHVTNVSILSGDLGVAGDSSDNSYHVITVDHGGANLLFNGITIMHGSANDTTSQLLGSSSTGTLIYNDYGAGAYVFGAQNLFQNVVFENNIAKRGGAGMFMTEQPILMQSILRLYGCSFHNNRVQHTESQDSHSGGAGILFISYSGAIINHTSFTANSEIGSQGGGAVRCITAKPFFRGCLFKDNSAINGDGGGAVYCAINSTPEFDSCSFVSNIANDQGGAVYCDNSIPTFSNCSFIENIGQGGAGAMELDGGSDAVIENSEFAGNSTNADGGAIQNWKSSPVIKRTLFRDNSAGGDGGAIFNYTECNPWLENVTLEYNEADSNGGAIYNRRDCSPIISNSLIHNNAAGLRGGGVYSIMSNSAPCSPILTNVTMTENSAFISGGGGFDDGSGNTLVRNTIIYNNNAPLNAEVEAPTSSIATALHRVIIGSEYYATGVDPPLVFTTGVFVDPLNDDFRPMAGSMAIDIGDSTVYNTSSTPNISGMTVDLGGKPRIMGSQIELGAYEVCSDTLTPIVSIDVFANDTVDSGTVIHFEASFLNGVSSSFLYSWLHNSDSLSSGDSLELSLTAGIDFQDGDSFSYSMTVNDPCLETGFAISNTIIMNVIYHADTTSEDSTIGFRSPDVSNFMIYPNPVTKNGVLNLNLADPYYITMTDLFGRVVLQTTAEHTIQLNGVTSGTYFVRLENENGYSTVRKLIISD